MTPTEALAAALEAAPNVTSRVATLFANADPTERRKVAQALARAIGGCTGVPWTEADVTALAEGLAGGLTTMI